MRSIKDRQGVLDFQGSRLRITQAYYERYEAISELLDDTPAILKVVHADLSEALEAIERVRETTCRITSENVLRVLIVQIVERLSLREVVVRVDDSNYLRRFTRIHDRDMMGYATLCELKNQIRPETWKKVNGSLAKRAVNEELITGDQLRIDTTAYETNIHYPTDSSLLFDVYRTMVRLISSAREIDPAIAGHRRLQLRAAKRIHTKIARKVGKNTKTETLKPLYKDLLGFVVNILEIGPEAAKALAAKLDVRAHSTSKAARLHLMEQLTHYGELGARVVDQTQRRVFEGEKVPTEEKLFSIVEPHTELLKRGKAGKPIEFGHMVLLQQTGEKFITDYEVFEKKPVEHELVDTVLGSHKRLFGELPSTFAADKGFYESMAKIEKLEESIEVVAIGKKGARTEEEAAREHSLAFTLGQAFRAGIEGSISYLKRALRLHRCFNKGWTHYISTVGATIFTHNLLVLARGSA